MINSPTKEQYDNAVISIESATKGISAALKIMKTYVNHCVANPTASLEISSPQKSRNIKTGAYDIDEDEDYKDTRKRGRSSDVDYTRPQRNHGPKASGRRYYFDDEEDYKPVHKAPKPDNKLAPKVEDKLDPFIPDCIQEMKEDAGYKRKATLYLDLIEHAVAKCDEAGVKRAEKKLLDLAERFIADNPDMDTSATEANEANEANEDDKSGE